MTTKDALDHFGDEVAAWHRANWPSAGQHPVYEAAGRVLGIAKVTEEAGELMGAVIKLIEGRADRSTWELAEAAYAELGDVVIAAAGALRRLNELSGSDRPFGEVVVDRWEAVQPRNYRTNNESP